MKTVAIMQPTLMPWLGYFALMDTADTFIYLDDVKYVKRSWQSRNRIKSIQGELMLSLSVEKDTTRAAINKVKLAEPKNHQKFMKSLAVNLGKAPYFDLTEHIVESAYRESQGFLSRFTIGIINQIALVSGITTERVLASSLTIEKQEKASRLLAFCRHYSADNYLSPLGSYAYLSQHNPFSNSGVDLFFQNYDHPEYPQCFGEFTAYLACVDALSWVGPDDFLPLIRSGVRTPLCIEELE